MQGLYQLRIAKEWLRNGRFRYPGKGAGTHHIAAEWSKTEHEGCGNASRGVPAGGEAIASHLSVVLNPRALMVATISLMRSWYSDVLYCSYNAGG